MIFPGGGRIIELLPLNFCLPPGKIFPPLEFFTVNLVNFISNNEQLGGWKLERWKMCMEDFYFYKKKIILILSENFVKICS